MSSYAGSRGEALPWGLVLVEGIIVALSGVSPVGCPGSLSGLPSVAAGHRPVD